MNIVTKHIYIGIMLLGMAMPLTVHANDDIAALQEKAKNGDADAQYALGKAYQSGKDVKQSDYDGVFWMTKAAEQGNTDAMLNLGIAYRGGFGVQQDYKKAYMWLEVAVLHGNKRAVEVRKDISGLLPLQDITEAQKIAADWKPQ